MKKHVVFGLLAFVGVAPGVVHAQHPVEVQQAQAGGEYVRGLALAYQMPRKRDTVESIVAAARSAWALGLPSEAEQWFQRALTFPSLSIADQAEVLFSLSAVLFTEKRWEEARLYASRASALALEDSAFRAQCHVLLGDILEVERRFAAAEREYLRALGHANESLAPEIYFRLGKIHYELGNTEQAQEMMLRLPLDSPRLPEALRLLARIAVSEQQYDRAREFLEQGRSRFASEFLDSWVDLVFLRAAVSDGNIETVKRIRDEAKKQYPLSDPWITLLDAEAESFLWLKREQRVSS